MGQRVKYYYRVTRSGDPIQGSNIKAVKKPLQYGYVQFIPVAQSAPCCTTAAGLPSSIGKKMRYYVRIDKDGLPIGGSLEKHQFPPKEYLWQEVIGLYCCTLTASNVTINTSTQDLIANLITLSDVKSPVGHDPMSIVEAGTITGTNMNLVIGSNGDVTIHQHNATASHSESFSITFKDGMTGLTKGITVTVTYTHP